MNHTPYITTLDTYFGNRRGFSVLDWVRTSLERDLTMIINNPFFDLPVATVWQPIDQEVYNPNKYDELGATKMILDFICLAPVVRKTDFSNNIVTMAEKCNNLIYSFGEEVRNQIVSKVLDYFKTQAYIIPILEYLGEISKYYKLNYNIPDTPTLYYSRYTDGPQKGQLREQTDELFRKYLRNYEQITTRHLILTQNIHIETCFSTILENIITLVKTNFIADVSNNTEKSHNAYSDLCEECAGRDNDEEVEWFCDKCNPVPEYLKQGIKNNQDKYNLEKELLEDPLANAEMSKTVEDIRKDNPVAETVVNEPDYGPNGEDDPENWRGATDEHLAELAELCKMADAPKSNLEDQYSSLDKSLYSCVVSTIPEFKRFQLLFLDKKNMALSADFFDTISFLYKQCGVDHKFRYINNPDNILTSNTIDKFKTLFDTEFYHDTLTIDSLVNDLKQFYKIMELESRYGKTIIPKSQKKETSKYTDIINTCYNIDCMKMGTVCFCKKGNVDRSLMRLLDNKNNDFSNTVQPMSDINIGSWINEADSVLETTDNYGYLADQWKADLSDKHSYKSIHIFYIQSSNQTIVCQNMLNDIVDFIKTYLNDFVEITYLDTMGQNVIDKIEEFFHIKEFDSLDEAKEKYVSFSNLYNLSGNTKGSHDEKNMILGYIKSNYNLSKDPAKRMKASVIQKEIETALRQFISDNLWNTGKDNKDFAKRISSYLLELDLNKKRFSDGIYYYGIEPKQHIESYEEKLASHKVLPLPPLQPVKYH